MKFNFCRLTAFVSILWFTAGIRAADVADSLQQRLSRVSEAEKTEIFNKLSRAFLSTSIDLAHQYCDSALQFAERFELPEQKALALKNKGILFYYQGLYAEALLYYTQSKTRYTLLDDKAGVAAVDNNMAIIYEIQGDSENAIAAHLSALRYFEQYGTKNEIARSYTNISTVYAATADYTKSTEYVRRALNLYLSIGDSLGVANSYNNLAADFNAIQLYDSALYYHQKSLDIRLKLNDSHGISTSLINLGNTFMYMNKPLEALEYLEQALVYIAANEDRRAETSVLIVKSMVLNKLNRNKEAFVCLQQAEELALKYNFMVFLRDVYQNYGIFYAQTGSYKKSYEYYTEYIVLKDSLLNIEKANYVADLESKYQFEKKNQQIQFQQEQLVLKNSEIEKGKTINLLISVLLVVAIVLIVVIGYTLHNKRKSHQRIEKQNNILLSQQRQITDSLNYAERIQQSVVASEQHIARCFNNSFLIYLPKDIVSGDFVWLRELDDKILFAVADCTGHGVPGAFMSMLSISFLNETVLRAQIPSPGIILDEMRAFIKSTLNQSGDREETKDGLNISLCVIEKGFRKMEYASAHQPMYLFRNGVCESLFFDRQPIGVYFKEKPFATHSVDLFNGDQLFLFSDGFIDQFSESGKARFTSKRFKELLANNMHKDMVLQKKTLLEGFNNWKGTHEQIDDVTVLGIRF